MRVLHGLVLPALVLSGALAFVPRGLPRTPSLRNPPATFELPKSLCPQLRTSTAILAGEPPDEDDLLKPEIEFDAITLGLLIGAALAFQFFVLANL